MADATWDQSKFDAALLEYIKVSSRTVSEAINTKAFYVARKALWYTPKASEDRILDTLHVLVTATREDGSSGSAPLAPVLINKRRKAKGEPGLFGSEMLRAERAFYAARLKSIAFLKSGWLPAIRYLDAVAKDKSQAAPMDRSAKQFGRDRGRATAADINTGLMVASIENSAIAKADKKDALGKYGGPALRRAFDDEMKSMLEYIERKMNPATAKANAAMA